MTNRKSSSYVCTLDVYSVADMLDLALIRKTVSVSNKLTKNKNRVVVRGRKPVVKMHYNGTYNSTKGPVSYDFGGNIVGGLANATVYDVYIYDRKDYRAMEALYHSRHGL